MKYFLLALLAFTLGCKDESAGDNNVTYNNASSAPPAISYSVVNIHPHDTGSFTEGLEVFDNSLYESTGEYGTSYIAKTDLKTGKAIQKMSIDKSLFGEGITIFNDKIYQLTYQHKKAFVYDLKTLKRLQEFTWPYEGWGMTHNASDLIISTGGSNLYYVNPTDFKIKKMISVMDNNGPVGNINELEFVNGVVYANVYQTNYIIKIDPETGKVIGRVDLSEILTKNNVSFDPVKTDVLNGIAYDSSKKSFYITGKYWPALFEVKLN
jgi:glutaminyl-peptide cyclotransferase